MASIVAWDGSCLLQRTRFATQGLQGGLRRADRVVRVEWRNLRIGGGCGVRCSADVAGAERRTRGGKSTAFDSEKGRPAQLPRKPREMTKSEKLDTFGRLRTPRAAREMALCILYAAMVRDVDPLKVYEERLNQRVGRDFDRGILESYEHNPADVGLNETEQDEDKAMALIQQQEEEADMEGTTLLAPLPLVYSRFVLTLGRKILKSTSERWIPQQKTIKALFPRKWRNEPEIAWIPLCIMQIAITEIETTTTPPKVVINEAIDLTRRFCDGAASRIVHGILAKYMENRQSAQSAASSSTEEGLE